MEELPRSNEELRKLLDLLIVRKSKAFFMKSNKRLFEVHVVGIGVARRGEPRGPGPPPIKIPLMTKSYDNIAWRCLVAVFFSVITHITVINNNINDNK